MGTSASKVFNAIGNVGLSVAKFASSTILPGLAGFAMGGPVGAAIAALPGAITGGSNLVSTIKGVVDNKGSDEAPDIGDIANTVSNIGAGVINNSSKLQGALGQAGMKSLNDIKTNLQAGASVPGALNSVLTTDHGRSFANNISGHINKAATAANTDIKDRTLMLHNYVFAKGKTNPLRKPLSNALKDTIASQELSSLGPQDTTAASGATATSAAAAATTSSSDTSGGSGPLPQVLGANGAGQLKVQTSSG